MCLVNQRSHLVKYKPQLLIENSWTYSIGNDKRKCAVYLEKVPDIVALRTNTGCNGGTTEMIGLRSTAKKRRRRKKWLYTSGNTIIANDP